MSEVTLPAMPHAKWSHWPLMALYGAPDTIAYSLNEMQAYAREAVLAERERAAKCEPELLEQLVAKQAAIDAAEARDLHQFLDDANVPADTDDHRPLTLLERVIDWNGRRASSGPAMAGTASVNANGDIVGSDGWVNGKPPGAGGGGGYAGSGVLSNGAPPKRA
jgi:hypothetical protein